jgi:hypothetical protein
LVSKILNVFKKKRINKDEYYPLEEYLEKIKIFKTILISYNELGKEKIETLSELLLNQLTSKSFSESGKHYLLDSFIHRAETKEYEKIEMILTGKGLKTSIRKIVKINE